MDKKTTDYFSEVQDSRVTGQSLHLLPELLMIAVCTYLTGFWYRIMQIHSE
jgi:hypothetical protein